MHALTTTDRAAPAVILFDGVCNLCNGAVLFVLDRDPNGHFQFAALQSEAGAELLRTHDYAGEELGSIILIEGARLYSKSAAALRIARSLTGRWPLLYGFIVVPRPVRDAVYSWVACNRYRWFGRTESCRVPSPALARRFLPRGSGQPA